MLMRRSGSRAGATRREVCAVVLTFFALGASSHPAGSEPQQNEQRAVPCAQGPCTIQLVRVTRVSGVPLASNLRTYSIFVEQDASGAYLTTTLRANQVVGFDTKGRLTLLGPTDKKPRVFVTIVPTTSGTPRAYAYDLLSRSLITLEQDGTFKDARPFPGFPSFMLADGNFIVAQQIRSPELAGYPVHVVDVQGNVLRSFGTDVPEYRADIELVTTRLATPGSNATIWTVAPGRYLFEQWNPATGARIRRVPVQGASFVDSVRGNPDPMTRPTDVIEAVWEKDRTLWALIRVADAKWTAPSKPPGESAIVPADYDRRYDWLLEAVDPASGNILARERFDRAMWGRSSASALLASLIDGGKSPGIDVWRFVLRGR